MSKDKVADSLQSDRSRKDVPLAIVMISLNESHNMAAVLDNIVGWAQEVFLVDSYSSDTTVDIALSRGVHVVQRSFRGFGDQWNFALEKLPISSPWTMKLDPDERITPALKQEIETALSDASLDALRVNRRLFFMGKQLPVRQDILRIWRTGSCKFSEVSVNEHPIVNGKTTLLHSELEHHDSPHLHHWIDKQNRYTTAEALAGFQGAALSALPRLFGTPLERRMWFKTIFSRVPFRFKLMWLYCLVWQGAWRAGRAGFIWSHLRSEVYRLREYKRLEMAWRNRSFCAPPDRTGEPNPCVPKIDTDNKRI
ncbi:glycosyltransferase family 2 protein [bacterium AH-315-P15]|nr:glycosyltransferase family 2 protein [bacterium AH-315-P15]